MTEYYLCRNIFASPHRTQSRQNEIQHFFANEIHKSEEANPSREGKIRLSTSLSRIYENKYLKYCEDCDITPMKKNKFYAVRKRFCPEVQRSKEYRKSKLFSWFQCVFCINVLLHTYVTAGGWNFLACEDCERIKKRIYKAKCLAQKRHYMAILNEHYKHQENHRAHYLHVS